MDAKTEVSKTSRRLTEQSKIETLMAVNVIDRVMPPPESECRSFNESSYRKEAERLRGAFDSAKADAAAGNRQGIPDVLARLKCEVDQLIADYEKTWKSAIKKCSPEQRKELNESVEAIRKLSKDMGSYLKALDISYKDPCMAPLVGEREGAKTQARTDADPNQTPARQVLEKMRQHKPPVIRTGGSIGV